MHRKALIMLAASAVLLPPLAFAKWPTHPIENRRWRIGKYRVDGTQKGDEQGVVEVAKTADIKFSRRHLSGSPTCGGLGGTYKLHGDELTIQPEFYLAGFCPLDQLGQNRLVLNALRGELRIEQKNDHIVLRDADGKA